MKEQTAGAISLARALWVAGLLTVASGATTRAEMLSYIICWTAVFLATTVATSVTGYGFPVDRLMPSHIVSAISLVVLAAAILARYTFRLSGAWRRTYVVCASIALYLNVFVAVVQAFQKAPVLKAMAPTQSEAPFVIAQLFVLALFAGLGIVAARKFRDTAIPAAGSSVAYGN